jgi:hypothetical protein
MNIKEFSDRYGTDTTTNFDLLQIAKQLKIPNFHIKMKDEIKTLRKIKKRPLYCVANYHLSSQNGVHWICFYIDKDKSYYFDSYGIVPLKEVKELLKGGVYSTFQIQQTNQKFCGQICMWILFQLSIGKDFFQTVLDLNEYFNIKK